MATTNNTLDGRVVLITGAASGIGAATALEVYAKGGIPVLLDCDAEPLAQMAQRCGPHALHWVADVTELHAMQDAVEKTLAELGRIDIVFANAGVAAFGPIAYIDPDAWKRCVAVNVFGVFNTIRAALPANHEAARLCAYQRFVVIFCASPCDVRLRGQQICRRSHGQFLAH
jgi:NADP-dependent 3-hydroxy acid dehydrogenase YdfG